MLIKSRVMQLVQYYVGKKIKKCHTTQLPVETTVPFVMFFVLSVEVKNVDRSLKRTAHLVIAPFQQAHKSQLYTPSKPFPQLLVGKVFTFQLNSHCFIFSPPVSTHFHTEITSLDVFSVSIALKTSSSRRRKGTILKFNISKRKKAI